jgi:hypothetical protein
MKTPFSLHRVAFAALAIGIASAPAIFADTTATNTTTTASAPDSSSGWSHHHRYHLAFLTAAERTELKKAKEAVLAANPSLKTQKENLRQQFKTLMANKATATPDQFKALHQQAEALHQQLRSAELLMDPNLKPIFAKIDAAKQAHPHSA